MVGFPTGEVTAPGWQWPLPFLAFALIRSAFDGLGRTRVGMLVGVTMNLLNGLLNWMLIFGKLGAPALGVRGAAMASSLSAVLAAAVILGLIRGISPQGQSHEQSMAYLVEALQECSAAAAPQANRTLRVTAAHHRRTHDDIGLAAEFGKQYIKQCQRGHKQGNPLA